MSNDQLDATPWHTTALTGIVVHRQRHGNRRNSLKCSHSISLSGKVVLLLNMVAEFNIEFPGVTFQPSGASLFRTYLNNCGSWLAKASGTT